MSAHPIIDEKHIDGKGDLAQDEEEALKESSNKTYTVEGMTPNQILAAYHANLAEHKLSNRASLRIYYKAVLWITILAFVRRRTSHLTAS